MNSAEYATPRPIDVAILLAAVSYGLVLVGAANLFLVPLGVVGALALGATILPHIYLPPGRRTALAWLGGALAFHGFAGNFFFWPLHLLVPLLAAVAAAWVGGWMTELSHCCRLGRLRQADIVPVAVGAVAAGAGVHAWLALAEPDLAVLRSSIPDLPIMVLVGAGLLFSVINALLEEIAWRGILLRWLIGASPTWLAVILQALSFGFAHWNGIPNGWSGVFLSGIFGVIMGLLTVRANSLMPAVVAHIGADLVIFAALAS